MGLISSLTLVASACSVFLFSVSSTAIAIINGDVNTTTTVEARGTAIWPFDKGPDAKLYCGPHYVDASHAIEYAFGDLIRQCRQNSEIKKQDKVALIGKYATAVAYVCSYDRKGTTCNEEELKNALAHIQRVCRNNEGGHVLQVGEVHLKGFKRAYGFTNDLDSIKPCEKKKGNWGLAHDVDVTVPPKKPKTYEEEYDEEYENPKPSSAKPKKNKKKKKVVYEEEDEE
ncbi:hypothetical protein V8F06_002598 [Rhypophila decipiens]